MAEKDYYKILGIDRNANKEEIKRAYKKLAKKHHPDINKESGSADKFKEISEAAAVLSDDNKKAQYDQFGSAGANFNGSSGFGGFSGFGSDDFDFSDIFSSFFGGSGFSSGRGRQRQRKGFDLQYNLEITLEEAAFGTKKNIIIPKHETCPNCKGSGAESSSDLISCPDCNGSGYVKKTQRTPFGIFQTSSSCSRCRGEGQVIKNVCHTCDGSGKVKKKSNIDVDIPAGVDNGTRLRVSGEGEAGERGAPSGDLFLIINVLEHKYFERVENDIYLEVPISFVQASLGDEIEVPTLKEKAKLTIPAGTQTNTVFRMKSKGIPSLHGYGKGDQKIKVVVKVPEKLNAKQKAALQDFGRLTKEQINPNKGFFSKIRDAFD